MKLYKDQKLIEKNWNKYIEECAILRKKIQEDLKFVDRVPGKLGIENETFL